MNLIDADVRRRSSTGRAYSQSGSDNRIADPASVVNPIVRETAQNYAPEIDPAVQTLVDPEGALAQQRLADEMHYGQRLARQERNYVGRSRVMRIVNDPTGGIDALIDPNGARQTAPQTDSAVQALVNPQGVLAQEQDVRQIDSNSAEVYNNQGGIVDARDLTGEGLSGITQDGVPGSEGDLGLVPERRTQSERNIRVSEIVLLNEQSQQILSQNGIADIDVVETTTDNGTFSAALEAARNADSKNGWAVTPQNSGELSRNGVRTFLTANRTSGFGITKDGDIIGVFANKSAGAPKGITRITMPLAISNGGVKLDCYGVGLVKLYAQYGFVPVAKVKFDPQYANPGWTPGKGTPDIYFMMHNGQNANDVVASFGSYHSYTLEELSNLPTMDYDAAYAYRDSLLENAHHAPEIDPAVQTLVDPEGALAQQRLADEMHYGRRLARQERNYVDRSHVMRIINDPTGGIDALVNPQGVLNELSNLDESTSANTDPAQHTPVEQAVIDEYQNSVDEGLVQYVEDVKNDQVNYREKFELNPVSERAAADIRTITGIDAAGFKTAIERKTVEHILNRHGENGVHDTSMRDVNDIARIQYILDHYDDIADGGTVRGYTTVKANGKPGLARSVVYSKAVNGTYYVVEAVPDTKRKTTYIVSAYMSKNGQKKGASHLTDTPMDAPVLTAETGVHDNSSKPEIAPADGTGPVPATTEQLSGSDTTIAESASAVNPIVRETAQNYAPEIDPAVQTLVDPEGALAQQRLADEMHYGQRLARQERNYVDRSRVMRIVNDPTGGIDALIDPNGARQTAPQTDSAVQALVNPQETVNDANQSSFGYSDVTYIDGQTPLTFRYAVVPAESLIASNDLMGNVNPNYPIELQPRDRTRGSSFVQVQSIMTHLNPRLLAESFTAQNGAPIIRPDGVVVGGNGRTLGIVSAYKNGQAQQYENYIKQNAQKYGVSQIPKHPVLVRVVDNVADWKGLSQSLNVSTAARYSATEQAATDASKLDNILGLLSFDDEGKFNTKANKPFIDRFINDLVPLNERNSLRSKDGLLSQEGERRVQYAVFQYAYDNPDLVIRLSESMDNDAKNVTNALLATAKKAAEIRRGAADGTLFDIGIVKTVENAVNLYTEIRSRGNTVSEEVMQFAFFEETYYPEEWWIALFIEENKRSSKAIRELIGTIYSKTIDAGSPNQTLLFETEGPNARDIVRRALIDDPANMIQKGHVRDAERLQTRYFAGRANPELENPNRTGKSDVRKNKETDLGLFSSGGTVGVGGNLTREAESVVNEIDSVQEFVSPYEATNQQDDFQETQSALDPAVQTLVDPEGALAQQRLADDMHYGQRLAQQERENQERIDKITERKDAQIQKERERTYNERMKTAELRLADEMHYGSKLSKLANNAASKVKQVRETHKNADLRENIARSVSSLATMLRSPTSKRFVPQSMIDTVTGFVQAIDIATAKDGKETKKAQNWQDRKDESLRGFPLRPAQRHMCNTATQAMHQESSGDTTLLRQMQSLRMDSQSVPHRPRAISAKAEEVRVYVTGGSSRP